MKEFITNNLFSIIVVAVLAIIVVVFWFAGKGKYRSKAKQILLALVIAAEEKYGGGTGEIKFAYVAEKLYALMPGVFQVLFSAETIAGWIEEAVEYMKKYLSENEDAAEVVAAAVARNI